MANNLTVFERTMESYRAWDGDGQPPAYPIYQGPAVALVDRFPRFYGQVVVFPKHGMSGEDVAPYDLESSIRQTLDFVVHAVQIRMKQAFPERRIIRHEEGFAVPDHPHTVLFPAVRGEGKRLYEPTTFNPDEDYFRTTQELLAIEGDEKRVVDERLAKLLAAVADWT